MKKKLINKEIKGDSNIAKSIKAHKFGVLDVAIVLIVLASVIGIYFRFNLIETLNQNANTKNVIIFYNIDNVRYTTPNYINVDDKVYFSSTGELLGTVINASEEMSNALNVAPSSEDFFDDGEYVEVFFPNSESRVDANGRLSCKGAYNDDRGLLINGSTHISAGQTISVKTELASFVITITSIEVSD